jgi:magnesium transporter
MIFTASALRYYEDALTRMEFLAIFLPLVIASGGNSGTQAASLIIRGIALNEMRLRDWFRIFQRELLIGCMLGGMLALLGFLRVVVWGYDFHVGLIIAMTLIGVVTIGAVAGAMLPFLFKSMGLDPAVVSSPFISTIVDLSGIVIYINIALIVLSYLSPT